MGLIPKRSSCTRFTNRPPQPQIHNWVYRLGINSRKPANCKLACKMEDLNLKLKTGVLTMRQPRYMGNYPVLGGLYAVSYAMSSCNLEYHNSPKNAHNSFLVGLFIIKQIELLAHNGAIAR